MKLKKLDIKDKDHFERSLGIEKHSLSTYAFQNIYIWKNLFNIYWVEIKNSLCIFFEDNGIYFLYLPPLGGSKDPETIEKVFAIMNEKNLNKDFSRIENIEERDIGFYKKLGYGYKLRSCDYMCSKNDLTGLKGDRFKSKRSAYNYFIKHYRFECTDLSIRHSEECLGLYRLWMEQRKDPDVLYQGMLKDNLAALEALFKSYGSLKYSGKIVKIDGSIKAFTIGFEINKEAFCVMYEVTDLSVKGLAQFIFREFSNCLPYKYINIMDDSGLDNLKRVKLSYCREKINSYSANNIP